MRCLLLAAVVVLLYPTNLSGITLQQGWYRGRKFSYYEFGSGSVVDVKPRMYTFATESAEGVVTPVPGLYSVIDTITTDANYTGLWDHLHIIVETPPAAPVTSSESLLTMATANNWKLVPTGYFTHCPLVEQTAVLEGLTDQPTRMWHKDQTYHCFLVGTSRHYPSDFIEVWDIKKFPTKVRVPENVLLDWAPHEYGFTPVLRKRTAYVAATYVNNSVRALASLLLQPHEVADVSEDIYVSWYITSMDPPTWDTAQWIWSRDLSTTSNPTQLWWTLREEEVDFKLQARFGIGWIGIGFGQAGLAGNEATVNLITYLDAKRNLCISHGYVNQGESTLNLITDNLMGVTNVTLDVDWRGTMTLSFTRRLQSTVVDSLGFTRPLSSIVDGEVGRLVWASQSGPAMDTCGVGVDKLVSPVYSSGWGALDIHWTSSNTAVPAVITTPIPVVYTPSPVLTQNTPTPPTVPMDLVRGNLVLDAKLSVTWEMRTTDEILFSLSYQGDLSAEKRWIGLGIGRAFQYSDTITVWYNKGGQVLVEDRKAAGLKEPPLDARQDVVLRGHRISAELTVVNFSRKLATGDVGTSVKPRSRTTLVQTVLRKYSGWYLGKRTDYYSAETPGGVFGGAQPFAAPLYRIQLSGSTELLPGQMLLIDSLPGQQGYSDLRQIITVNPPAGYQGPVISWVRSIPSDWTQVRTSIFMNCPVVHDATTLEEDPGTFPKISLWYNGELVRCIDFSVRATSLPTLYPLAWASASDPLNGTLVNTSTTDMTYTGVWNLYTYNSTTDETVTSADVLSSVLADATLNGYVNRPIVKVHDTVVQTTPSPDVASNYDNTMYLSSEPGNEVILRWTIVDASGTMQVEVESEVGAQSMVSVGFSATTYQRMANADIVLGYVGTAGASCVRTLYAINEVGAPTGVPQLVVTNRVLNVVNGKLRMSFTRTLSDASTEGIIPTNPYQSMRVLYATAASITGACNEQDVSFLNHGTSPHGSRVIYWRLQDGAPSVIPSAAPSTGLSLPLDQPVAFNRQTAWFASSSVTHYTLNNTLQGNSTYVPPMYVYDIWWPAARNAIIDAVPGIATYSDLMKVRRVRLPDGFPDEVTSLDQLRTSNAFIEDTDYYWNCPVVSLKATFDSQDTIELKQLWYKDQLVQCAHFGNLTSTRVNPVYEVWSGGVFTGSRVLSSTPSSVGYSPFNWVVEVAVADSNKDVRSAAELLSVSISTTDASPPRLLNMPIVQIDAGTPLQLTPIVLPLQTGWLDNREVRYLDFSALYGKIPTLQDTVVTANVFAFRSLNSYWAPEVQPNVISVVPGQTGYADLWKVTLVVVPAGTSLPITSAGDIPDAWKTESLVIINCPVVHKDTTISAYPDGTTPLLPKQEWWWNGTRITCFLFEETLAGTGPILGQLTRDVLVTGSAAPVFTSWPGDNGGGLSVPQNFAGLNGVVYTSAAMVTGFTLSKSPWAVNWPIIFVVAAQRPASVAYNMVASQGLYRGKAVDYWLVVNSTAPPMPTVIAPAQDTIQETVQMPTARVYVFRRGGVNVEDMLPVFDFRPGEDLVRDGVYGGYSDLKRVFFVEMPDNAPITSLRSVEEVANQGWPVTEATGLYYNWPLCDASTVLPQSMSLLTGWSKSVFVYYVKLTEQTNTKISKAFRVTSGMLVFPLVPESADYTAFHTIWEVAAPDSFDPSTDLALYSFQPVYPIVVLNLPILAAPSASTLTNEVDTQKVYDKKAAWMGGREVQYYSFTNTPLPSGDTVVPMAVYALRYGTAYSSKPVQASEIAIRSAGQPGYSDLQSVQVVEATGVAAFPLRSAENLLSEALNNSWSIVPTNLERVAPMVHPGSLLSDEAHRLRYPKKVVYQGGREVVVMDFGFSDQAKAQIPIYKVVNANNLVSYILSASSVPAARFCREVVKFADTTTYPLIDLDPAWTECHQRTEQACPREHCIWNGTCIQPETRFVCALVSQSQGRAPLVTLSRETGWFDGRRLTYYSSPNTVPGNATHTVTDTVYVFRFPAARGQQPLEAAGVPGLLPVFTNLPGTESYSDVHKLMLVTVPLTYSGGLIETREDVLNVVAAENWVIADTGTIVNWWVVHASSTLEDRDTTTVPKNEAWAEGEKVAYFDFGSINSIDHKEKFVLVRNGQDVVDNDIFIQAELVGTAVGTPYSHLVWEVAVAVDTSYVSENFTTASQLSGLVPNYRRQTIANNPIMTLEAPVNAIDFDDLVIDPSQPQDMSWAYGQVESVTQQLLPCEAAQRGRTAVSLQTSTTTNPPIPPVGSDIRTCMVLTPVFTFCWEILAITPDTITVTFKIQTGSWVGVALSHEVREGGPRNSDVWLGYRDISGPQLTDRWIGQDHVALPSIDTVLGGSNDLSIIAGRSVYSAQRDYHNITFTRKLVSPDTAADISINSSSIFVSWATGTGDIPTRHSATSTLCINFYTSQVEFGCIPTSRDEWWVPFTIILLSWAVLCGFFLVTYSQKNSVLHTVVLFKGSVANHLTAAQVVLIAVYVTLVGIWVAMSADKYYNLKLRVPSLRAFGSGAVLCFSLMLLPVARSSPLLWAVGISKQRAARWHKWNGILLLLLVTIHGIGMVATYATDAVSWKSGDTKRQPGLAGLLAFVGLLFQGFVATSPFGGRLGWFKRRYYEAFQVIHMFGGIWSLVWAVIHHPPLLYGVLFSIVVYIIDKLFYFYQWMTAMDGWSTVLSCISCFLCRGDRTPRSAFFSCQDESFNDGRKLSCLELKVVSSDHSLCYDTFRIDAMEPLQHVLVRIPSAGREWHPVGISCRPVHVEDDQHDPFKGSPTTSFTLHVGANDSKRHTWSARVHQLACSMERLGSVQVMGPYGRPAIDFRSYEHLILIGGGIGAAPLMSILGYYLDPVWGKQAPAGKSRTKLITLIWAAKDRKMFDVFCDGSDSPGVLRMALDIDYDARTSNKNFAFRMFLHETSRSRDNPLQRDTDSYSPGGLEQLQQIADAKATETKRNRVQLVYNGRPNLFQRDAASSTHPNVFDDFAAQNELGNTQLPGLTSRITSAGVVACGPPSLMRAVRASVDKHNMMQRGLTFHLHSEMWT